MNTRVRRKAAAIAVVALGVVGVSAAAASGGSGRAGFGTQLSGYEEVPAYSTTGEGRFAAALSRSTSEIRYRLTYEGLTGPALQAHIHFAQEGVNGGISVYLCTNLGNGPAGTQACPAGTAGQVTGTIRPVDVLTVMGQGIAAGEFAELVAAMRADATYVNVHTQLAPGGEIRGQLEPGDDDDDEGDRDRDD
jgi:hypothetical protein